MRYNHKKGIAVIVLMAFGLCASGGVVKKEYSYAGMDGQSHQIEVCFPENHEPGGKAPCFVFFHGGGWVGGNLNAGRPFCEYLASRGMVALTANYSMHPKNELENLPAGESKKRICVMDGKTVVRWVKKHAQELGIDPEKMVVGGASAGGHISVLQMMDEQFNNPAESPAIKTDAQAFVLLCPAFTVPERDPAPDMSVFQWLKKKFPPTLFIVGETDKWKKASDLLIEKLAEAEADIEVWMGPQDGHMFFRTKDWITPTLIRIDEFLTENGFLEGPPALQPAETDRTLVRMNVQQ